MSEHDTEHDTEGLDQNAMADDWAAALDEQAAADGANGERGQDIGQQDQHSGVADSSPAVDPLAQFQQLEVEESEAGKDVNLDVILDIPVTIAMEIGRTKINIRNLLQLNQGSVVELDRLAGEPMDVLVNGTLIAHGEVVGVNDKFGSRLTDVISPAERVRKLT